MDRSNNNNNSKVMMSSSSRKQLQNVSHGSSLNKRMISSMSSPSSSMTMMMNSSGDGSSNNHTSKKFTKKDLEQACRKQMGSRSQLNSIVPHHFSSLQQQSSTYHHHHDPQQSQHQQQHLQASNTGSNITTSMSMSMSMDQQSSQEQQQLQALHPPQQSSQEQQQPYNHQAIINTQTSKKAAQQVHKMLMNSSASTQVNDTAGNQLKLLDAGVKLCARKFNESKAHAEKLEETLRKKLDEYKELKQEADGLKEMIHGINPEAQRIKSLNEDIEKANKKSQERLQYRLFLNHMLQRSRKNSISLDSHLSAMTETMVSVEKEKQKCERMLGEVESGCRKAFLDLEALRKQMDIERSERQRALAGKRIESENAERIEEWRNEREKSKLELEKSLGGAHRREMERKMKQLREYELQLEKLNTEMESKNGDFGTLEEAFTHIKQSTGINTLTEMVDKFTHHQEHRDRLLVEKKEAEERLNEVKNQVELAHVEYDTVKAEGFGDTDLSRDVISEISANIMKEKADAKIVKSTNMRLEGVLVGLRQGGMGLYQRLLAFHPTLLDGEAPKLSESATTSAIQAAYDTLEMLKVTEQILGKMLDSVGGLEKVTAYQSTANNIIQGMESEVDGKHLQVGGGRKEPIIEALENPNLGDNNCRIKPRELSPRYSDDEDGDDYSGYNSDPSNDDPDSIENIVLSRHFLKSNSEKQASEARRQVELEEKRRKLLEKTSVDDNEGQGNENSTSAAAMKKRQAEANSRMAQHSVPKGYPKSTTIRDDPLTKAQAFLTEMPQLD